MTVHFDTALLGSDAPIKASPPRVPPHGPYAGWLKRALDIALVLVASVPVALTVAILALLVSRDGHSPFYLQDRIGRGGRVFRMWKLRSMVADADRILEVHLASDPAARAEWDHHQKLRHDPRITPIGQALRKSSLDELPQLWNVLLGDMSLVGPRPIMRNQRGLYPGTDYYTMRPGITGLWQISIRNESSFHDRAGYDTDYASRISLGTDLRVIVATFRVVLRGTGI